MLNVLLKVAAGVAVAYGIGKLGAGQAGWYSESEIETEEELKEIYSRHRDWLVGRDGGIFVEAPDGKTCLGRLPVGGEVIYYAVSESLVRRLYSQ